VNLCLLSWANALPFKEMAHSYPKEHVYQQAFGSMMDEDWFSRDFVGRVIAMSLKYRPSGTRKATKTKPFRSLFEFRAVSDLQFAMLYQIGLWYKPFMMEKYKLPEDEVPMLGVFCDNALRLDVEKMKEVFHGEL
jgi:hypothetical protein